MACTHSVQIDLLADRPEFVPTLAEWHFREWAYLRPGDSVANRIRLLRERSGRRELPITFIASSGAELLGSAMLMHHEMDIRPTTPLGLPAFSSLLHSGGGASVVHSRNMSSASQRNAVFAHFISSRRVLRLSFRISAGVLSNRRATEIRTSRSCRILKSPNPIARANRWRCDVHV